MRRALLLACLLTGLLLPKMGTALASALPNIMVYVICTAQGMEMITVDAEGNLVEVPVAMVDTCLGDAPAPDHSLALAWHAFAAERQDPFRAIPRSAPVLSLRLPPAQGPPSLS